MKHKQFTKDIEYIELMVIQLRSLSKEYRRDEITKNDMLKAMNQTADKIEEKLDDIIKDVYSDLIHKGEWLDNRGNELPI